MSAVVKIEQPQQSALTPMDMLNRAVASGANIDVLEKLMALQERWEKNQARKDFNNAVAEAKAKMPLIVKNREGHNGKRYADFAAIAKVIDPVIAAAGLDYRFRSQQDEKTIKVSCILSHRSGHSEENTLAGPADASGSKNAIQAIGSTLSYLQRYSLIQALGLAVSEDDDGHASGQKQVMGGNGHCITDEQVREIGALLTETKTNLRLFLKEIKLESLSQIGAANFERAMKRIRDNAKLRDVQ